MMADTLQYQFKNPRVRLNVKGIGIVHQGNLTNEMAVRLLRLNPKYSQFIERKDGKDKDQKRGGTKEKGRKQKAKAEE